MDFIIGFLAGAVIGAAIALIVGHIRSAATEGRMREAFSSLASQALDANTRRLLEQLDGAGRQLTESAAAQMEGKKALIDQTLVQVGQRLEAVRAAMQSIEAQRKQDFGQLSESVSSLAASAGELHQMLASTQRRGAWGERMAEDILRLAGMQEGVNYLKQSSADADAGRPDFTFFLPNDLKCNMDVKFPLESYKAYVDAAGDAERAERAAQLASAVRGHVRAVAARGYIDPKVPTVPYVIVFIPSEQIFSLALASDPDLIDEAMKGRVVLSSPLTLYAMLSVVRQAAESANVMKTADEVISLLGEFSHQWLRYTEETDKLGRYIDQVAKQYEALRTTRANMLQRPLDRIENLRQSGALPDPNKT